MAENVSIKIRRDILEKLKLQYSDMSYNEIFELIASEEEYRGRQMYPPVVIKQCNILLSYMREQFKDITPKEIIDKVKQAYGTIPPHTTT